MGILRRFLLYLSIAPLALGVSDQHNSSAISVQQEISSRAPFSLELPDLGWSSITKLEVRIPPTPINSLRLRVCQPFADKIEYHKIYTVVNGESAKTIHSLTSDTGGKVVTLDLKSKPDFRLRPGKNVVEISATDNDKRFYYASFVLITDTQLETSTSRRAPRISARFSGRKFGFIVGISKYKFNEGGLNDLNYADADARSIREFLMTSRGGGFSSSDLFYLTNEEATVEGVRAALRLFLPRATENDLVFIFFAGHGAPDPFDPQMLYLLLHDSKVADLPATGLRMSEVQSLLDGQLSARRVVVLIDACHSAGISGKRLVAGRQLERAENNLFNLQAIKLFREEGRAVLTSSDVNEISEEGINWGGGHGVFTWALLQGLDGAADLNNDRVITAGELFDFVSDKVRKETKFRQNPRALPGTNKDFPLATGAKDRDNRKAHARP